MSDPVRAFFDHFRAGGGTFRMHMPAETSYEEMVRKYEAGDPGMRETMKLVSGLPFSAPTPEQELALWKQRAADERTALRDRVPVRHTVTKGLGMSPAFEERVGGTSGELLALYRRLHSAELYVDDANPDGGFLFYPVSAMDGEHADMLDWLDDGEDGFEERVVDGRLELVGCPPWVADMLVFAGIGQSAERFLLACGGPHQGSVFAFEHDMLGFHQVARSFVEFLDTLRSKPLAVAQWVGLYGAEGYDHAA